MTPKELADKLDGREYLKEITKQEEEEAKASGLYVLFAQSDDLVEIRGIEEDELGAPCTLYFNEHGLLQNECEERDCPYFARERQKAIPVVVKWCEPDYPSWTFWAAIKHETFRIMEYGEVFCLGIVFSLKDVKPPLRIDVMEGK